MFISLQSFNILQTWNVADLQIVFIKAKSAKQSAFIKLILKKTTNFYRKVIIFSVKTYLAAICF